MYDEYSNPLLLKNSNSIINYNKTINHKAVNYKRTERVLDLKTVAITYILNPFAANHVFKVARSPCHGVLSNSISIAA